MTRSFDTGNSFTAAEIWLCRCNGRYAVIFSVDQLEIYQRKAGGKVRPVKFAYAPEIGISPLGRRLERLISLTFAER